MQSSSQRAWRVANYPLPFWLASSLEKALNVTDLSWNHFQHIWIAHFCATEEGSEYEYTPT